MITFLRKTQKIFSIILIVASILVFIISYCLNIFQTKEELQNKYNSALLMISDRNNCRKALDILTELGNYQESKKYTEIAEDWIRFQEAESDFYSGRLEDALEKFSDLAIKDGFPGRTEAKDYILKIQTAIEDRDVKAPLYDEAIELFNSGQYLEARTSFSSLVGYKDSDDYEKKCDIIVKILQNSNTVSSGTQLSAGITKGGKVESCGDNPLSDEIKSWKNIVSISVFGSLAIGLKIDGTVVTAGGLNEDYRIETGNWEDIVSVSAGDLYIVGLRSNGKLVAQGHNGDGQTDIDDWTNIKAIDTGWRHTVGLTNNGEVLIAGLRHEDEEIIRNNPKEWHDIVAISAGGGKPGVPGEQGHTVGLRSDGTVVAVGDNGRGQCDFSKWEGEKIVAIAAGGFYTVGLTEDGRVVTTQESQYILDDISKWEDDGYKMVAIAAGYGTTFAIDTEGNVHSTGHEDQHQRDTADWGKLEIHEKEWESIRPRVQ